MLSFMLQLCVCVCPYQDVIKKCMYCVSVKNNFEKQDRDLEVKRNHFYL